MRRWLAGAAMALVAAPASAMVPAHLQRQNELRNVLELAELLPLLGAPIDRVERVAPGLWRVTTGRCRLDVRIVAVPPARPGLTGPRYEARPGRPVCAR